MVPEPNSIGLTGVIGAGDVIEHSETCVGLPVSLFLELNAFVAQVDARTPSGFAVWR